MKKWTAFTSEELKKMAEEPKPYEDNSESKCPCCQKDSVRFYFRETNISRLIGSSWYWCKNCLKFAHFTSEPLSTKYIFTDPLSKIDKSEIEQLHKRGKWYEYLDSLWEKGVLPLVFKRKS